MSFTGRAPRAVLLRFKRIASKPCEHSPLRSLAQRPPRCTRSALRLGEIRRHWQPGRRAWTHPPRHQLRILILGSLRQAPPWLAYYDPAPWRWVRAVRVRHIIGRLSLIGLLLWPVTLIYTLWCVPDRAPLMKCYLDSKDTGTIPSHLAKYREQYFNYGHAEHGRHLGSKVCELNTLAWQFGRPMLEWTGLSVLSTSSLLSIVRMVDFIVCKIVKYC